MFKSIGLPEILLILLIVFIFFGAGKLPQVGEQFGKAIRAFKKSQSADDGEEAKAEEQNLVAADKSSSHRKKSKSAQQIT